MADVQYGNSWVDIANRALGRIGKARIDTLTSGDELAQYVNTFLGEAVEYILSARSWSIATRIELARSASAPVFGYSYAYVLPTDHINTIAVATDGSPYLPEGWTILTDSETVYLVYIARPADPSILPGYLKKAISTHLAFLLSTPLTSSDALAARIAQESALALNEAITADARRHEPGQADPWYDEAR
ncbi:MAG: hypothetical protein KKB59_14130 [Spirochaetes bacterium]|nr:hypothetical protein [Spirochaetota bacterium]